MHTSRLAFLATLFLSVFQAGTGQPIEKRKKDTGPSCPPGSQLVYVPTGPPPGMPPGAPQGMPNYQPYCKPAAAPDPGPLGFLPKLGSVAPKPPPIPAIVPPVLALPAPPALALPDVSGLGGPPPED